MPELTKEQITEINKLTIDMRAQLEKSQQDVITADMVSKMINDVVDKIAPAKKDKFEYDTVEGVLAAADEYKRNNAFTPEPALTSEYGKRFGTFRGFLNAVVHGKGRENLQKTMVEGTAASGGFVVPTEFLAEMITLGSEGAILRRIARLLPMTSWKRVIPRQLTNVTVYWPEEVAAKTPTGITGEQLTQQAKVCAAIIKSSDELLRDSAINLQTFLAGLVGEAMFLEEDRLGFVGDVSGLSDPFNGVYYATGVNTVTMGGASMAGDDIINFLLSLPKRYRTGATLILDDVILKIIMKLKTTTGDYIWSPPTGNIPAMIWGQKYEETDQLPNTLGTGTETPMLFGNFKKYLYLSPREEMTLKISQDASDWVSGALDSAFMTDQTWMRWINAKSIDIALPAAFSKMLVK